MIKQGTTTKIPKGFSKVMRGDYLVWENAKKVSWNAGEDISIFGGGFKMPSSLVSKIKGRQLISLKIGNYKEIDGGNIKGVYDYGYLEVRGTFYKLLGTQENIPKGTKITITYK